MLNVSHLIRNIVQLVKTHITIAIVVVVIFNDVVDNNIVRSTKGAGKIRYLKIVADGTGIICDIGNITGEIPEGII